MAHFSMFELSFSIHPSLLGAFSNESLANAFIKTKGYMEWFLVLRYGVTLRSSIVYYLCS